MEQEMFAKISVFNVCYFKIGEAVRVHDTTRNYKFDGLILVNEKERIGVVRIEWVSPMSGSAGNEPKTYYIDVKEVLDGRFKIEKL